MTDFKTYESTDPDVEMLLSVMLNEEEFTFDTFDSGDSMITLSKTDALELANWIQETYREKD